MTSGLPVGVGRLPGLQETPVEETPTRDATATPEEEATMTPTATDEPEETRPAREDLEVDPEELPVEVFPTFPAGGVTNEAPASLVADVKADLSGRLGIGEAEISVHSAESVVWPDGSMGCPQPGMMYTMALVPGYRVVLEAGGSLYDYHASERGGFILCEGGSSKPGLAPVSTPSQ
jgi:hypothetical protein